MTVRAPVVIVQSMRRTFATTLVVATVLSSVVVTALPVAAAMPPTSLTVTWPLDAVTTARPTKVRVAIAGGATADGWVVFYDFPPVTGGSMDEIGTTTTRVDRSQQAMLAESLGQEFTVHVAACDDIDLDGSIVDVPWSDVGGFVPCAAGALGGWAAQTETFVLLPEPTWVGPSRADIRARRVRWKIEDAMTGPGWIPPTGWTLQWARANGSGEKLPGIPWKKVQLGAGARSAILDGAGSGYWAVRLTMKSAEGPVNVGESGYYFP